MALSKSQKSLNKWTKQDWRTKSGKPSTQGSKATGERYLPAGAIKAMSSGEYAASTAKKRKDTKLVSTGSDLRAFFLAINRIINKFYKIFYKIFFKITSTTV